MSTSSSPNFLASSFNTAITNETLDAKEQNEDNEVVYISSSSVLKPGVGLGKLELGESINKCVKVLKNEYNLDSKQIQVYFSNDSPIASLSLACPSIGLRLIFDPIYQLLRIIEVSSLAMFDLIYEKLIIFGPKLLKENISGETLSMKRLYSILGPTFKGTSLSNFTYVLKYSGLTLLFGLKERVLDSLALPLVLSDGSSPQLKYLYINHVEEVIDFANESLVLVPRSQDFDVSVKLCEGLNVVKFLKVVSMPSICLNDSEQSVLLKLGHPNRISFKKEDKMKIHSSGLKVDVSSKPILSQISLLGIKPHQKASKMGMEDLSKQCFRSSPYFLNYFDLGIDFLIHDKSHRVLKIIIHGNYPGENNFLVYNRCKFFVENTEFSFNSTLEEVKKILPLKLNPVINESEKLTEKTYLYTPVNKDIRIIPEFTHHGFINSLTLY